MPTFGSNGFKCLDVGCQYVTIKTFHPFISNGLDKVRENVSWLIRVQRAARHPTALCHLVLPQTDFVDYEAKLDKRVTTSTLYRPPAFNYFDYTILHDEEAKGKIAFLSTNQAPHKSDNEFRRETTIYRRPNLLWLLGPVAPPSSDVSSPSWLLARSCGIGCLPSRLILEQERVTGKQTKVIAQKVRRNTPKYEIGNPSELELMEDVRLVAIQSWLLPPSLSSNTREDRQDIQSMQAANDSIKNRVKCKGGGFEWNVFLTMPDPQQGEDSVSERSGTPGSGQVVVGCHLVYTTPSSYLQTHPIMAHSIHLLRHCAFTSLNHSVGYTPVTQLRQTLIQPHLILDPNNAYLQGALHLSQQGLQRDGYICHKNYMSEDKNLTHETTGSSGVVVLSGFRFLRPRCREANNIAAFVVLSDYMAPTHRKDVII
ncbi:hypothetical protein CSKR_106923 [Clonorchis sinensis]|uniref:Uncharacterized protein n=1 Tax=Clonorchis sinensis TaxID=79923 RepID=A0A419Q1M3_CLOSI|nr:hypothetical protein CSKR_106923 [Clonorchis sinensis]